MNSKKVEVLMSAMHQNDFEIAYRSNVQSDLLIINQCDKNDYQEITVNGYVWRMISSTDRGLSKSRNMALENAKGDLCLFADDDEILEDNYVDTILKAYNELKSPAAIVFNIHRINNKMKKNYYKITKIKKAPTYRAYGSPMLSINLALIKDKSIVFNEKFGSGTEWGGGEDSLFEYDIIRKGLKMYEYPAYIATIDYGNGSGWFSGYNEKCFYNLGAFVSYRYKNIFLRTARKLFTCYRLRREKNLSVKEKMRWMYLGGKGIKNNVTYKQFLEQQSSNKS